MGDQFFDTCHCPYSKTFTLFSPQPNEMNMTYDEYVTCEEKPKKSKASKKRGRSPSPPAQTPKGGRKAKG